MDYISLNQTQRAYIKELIAEYNNTEEMIWSEVDRILIRAWYYEVFLESFGQSRRCWMRAIERMKKEI